MGQCRIGRYGSTEDDFALELLQLPAYIVGTEIMESVQMDNHPDSVKFHLLSALSYDEQSKYYK